MEPLLEALKALHDENRLKLVSLMMQKDCCVGALAQHLGISKGAVSQHLQILRKAGFIVGEKRGYYTHYRVNREKLQETSRALLNLAEVMPAEPCSCSHDDGEHHCCNA